MMSHPVNSPDTLMFSSKLAEYKQLIDEDITQFSKQWQRETLQQFGKQARTELDAYLNILARGGKRIRGALAIASYEMCGGTDKRMILQAARALEMLHAYILIVDDFQDRSATRRGGPTAHKFLAQYHESNELAGSAEHFGASIALNAALSGAHAAQNVLVNLPIDPALKLKALDIINQTMIVTAHGQTNDIINEVVAEVSDEDIDHVLEWKTAHYTFLNPISVGMVLAGADQQIKDIHRYAIYAGKAFQITDDLLGTFGTEFDSGKSPMDDIREGKRTLITEYALAHTSDDNKNFLIRMLGNSQLSPVEFERCKQILVDSGAFSHAKAKAEQYVENAIHSVNNAHLAWGDNGVAFLTGLAYSLINRTT